MNLATPQELRLYKESVRLSSLQKEFLIGTILGDGNVRFVARNREASLIVDHSLAQKDYVLWKYGIMNGWVLTEPKELNRRYHKDRSKTLKSFRFSTISHPTLTSLYNIFYRNGIKIIPENIGEVLTSPFSLAAWFMDDGNKNHQAVFLNTQQFSLAEQERLRKCLLKNFDLESSINKHWVFNGRQLYRIRISTESTKKLYDLVKDFILPSMLYKFPLYPRNDFVPPRRDEMAVL